MPPLSDLALMIQSRYPFIAVETSEEDRLETTLSRVAGDLRVPFFVWTVTNGLHRRPAERHLRQPAAAEGAQQRRRDDR